MYRINVGDFTAEETVYHSRCLSAGIGVCAGIETDTIPWEGTEYNPWDYKYEDGQFALEPICIPPSPHYDELEDTIESLNMLGVNANG